LRGGGEGSLVGSAGLAPLGSLWKNLRMPLSSFNSTPPSSSDRAGESDESDESSLDSSSAMLQGWFAGGGWCCGMWRVEVEVKCKCEVQGEKVKSTTQIGPH
jgi:hypothetical protein